MTAHIGHEANERRTDLVPGQMHCARCKFQLTRTNLYVNSGTVGAGDSKTEPCPNGCGPLWPVTWEQAARDAWATCETLFERAKAAEDALTAVNPPRLVASRAEPGAATAAREPDEHGRKAFACYIKDCEECAIVPDVAGAFHWAWTHLASREEAAAAIPFKRSAFRGARANWTTFNIRTEHADEAARRLTGTGTPAHATPEPDDTPLETGEADAR